MCFSCCMWSFSFGSWEPEEIPSLKVRNSHFSAKIDDNSYHQNSFKSFIYLSIYDLYWTYFRTHIYRDFIMNNRKCYITLQPMLTTLLQSLKLHHFRSVVILILMLWHCSTKPAIRRPTLMSTMTGPTTHCPTVSAVNVSWQKCWSICWSADGVDHHQYFWLVYHMHNRVCSLAAIHLSVLW